MIELSKEQTYWKNQALKAQEIMDYIIYWQDITAIDSRVLIAIYRGSVRQKNREWADITIKQWEKEYKVKTNRLYDILKKYNKIISKKGQFYKLDFNEIRNCLKKSAFTSKIISGDIPLKTSPKNDVQYPKNEVKTPQNEGEQKKEVKSIGEWQSPGEIMKQNHPELFKTTSPKNEVLPPLVNG